MNQSRNFPSLPTRYPYVVVRPMPAVYVKKPVVFTKDQPTRLKLGEPTFLIQHPEDAYDENGTLKNDALETLLRAVEKRMQEWTYRCCVVLAKDRCIFQEFGNIRNPSFEPPSGGVQLDHLITPTDINDSHPRLEN